MSLFYPLIAMAPPQGNGQASNPMGMMGTMVIFFLIIYVMMIRPQQRKEKERRAMLEKIKKGDKVMFAGGLLGTVAQVEEKVVRIKIADNVRVEVARGAVSAILEGDEDITDPATA